MKNMRYTQNTRQGQQGATAIEFSIVFALLFATFWAIISYALPFFMYQTMNHAVAEAARQIVRFDNLTPAETEAEAEAELLTQLNRFLPATFVAQLELEPTVDDNLQLTGTDSSGNPTEDADGDPTGLNYRVLTIRAIYPGCNATTLRSTCITPALNLLGASIPNLGPYTAETRIRLARNP